MIDEELERKMYWKTKELLERSGYTHYEVSNFAKTGYESKHNLNCWDQKEYIGFGVAAHSYINKVRYSNLENIEKYINNIKTKEIGKNKIIHEKQTEEEQEKEYMLLGLRKIQGISIKEYKNKFGKNPQLVYKQELEKLTKQELIEINERYIYLSKKGLDFANIVWEEFV